MIMIMAPHNLRFSYIFVKCRGIVRRGMRIEINNFKDEAIINVLNSLMNFIYR